MIDGKRLRIFMQDHLAAATAGLELARRTRGANEGTDYGEPLARVADEIEADRSELEAMLTDLGFGPDRPGGPARVIDDNGKKGDANKAVIDALIEKNMLFARGRLKHSYPHSWRSKKPVIFRNTPQWFIAMDKPIAGPDGKAKPGDTLRQRALTAIKVTRWVPPQGENRITAMVADRPDWVISRQRAWGVPITVFVRERGDGRLDILKDERVNARIAEAFVHEGTDAWFEPPAVQACSYAALKCTSRTLRARCLRGQSVRSRTARCLGFGLAGGPPDRLAPRGGHAVGCA